MSEVQEVTEAAQEAQENSRIWTDQLRLQILRQSEKDLWFFARSVCGYSAITLESHGDLCEKLDGRSDWGPDWNRAVIGAFRGWFKTSIIRAFALREAVFKLNLSARYFGGSYDNAHDAFLEPIKNLFQKSEGAEFRKWLLGPSEFFPTGRLPKHLEGWKDDQIWLQITDANAQAALSIRGVSSKPESYHGNLIIIDDPEGIEAEKGGIQQVDALKFVSSANPLLINPQRDRIVLIGTSHGPDPTIYRALYENFNPEDSAPQGEINWDNRTRAWKAFWQPIYRSDGTPAFPIDGDGVERFGKESIDTLKRSMSSRDFNMQYLLLRGAIAGSWWSRKLIEKNFAKWERKDQIISYPYLKVDMQKYRETGKLESKLERHQVRTDEMLYFLHYDPKHKKYTSTYQRSKIRPSRAAAVVTGTTPDGHIIVMDYWLKAEVDIDEQLEQLRLFHVKYGARKMIFDPVGAQDWVPQILKTWERNNPIWHNLSGKSLWGETRMIPRLSAIAERDKRSPKLSKEEMIHARLDPYLSTGRLHFLEGQDELVNEIVGLPDATEFVDGTDALAQGAAEGFWLYPAGRESHEELRRGQEMLRQIGLSITHYRSPLHKPPSPTKRIRPEEGKVILDGHEMRDSYL